MAQATVGPGEEAHDAQGEGVGPRDGAGEHHAEHDLDEQPLGLLAGRPAGVADQRAEQTGSGLVAGCGDQIGDDDRQLRTLGHRVAAPRDAEQRGGGRAQRPEPAAVALAVSDAEDGAERGHDEGIGEASRRSTGDPAASIENASASAQRRTARRARPSAGALRPRAARRWRRTCSGPSIVDSSPLVVGGRIRRAARHARHPDPQMGVGAWR